MPMHDCLVAICAGTAQIAEHSGEIAFANFSSGAAPASGIIRKIKKVKIFCLTNTGCIVTIAQVWKKS